MAMRTTAVARPARFAATTPRPWPTPARPSGARQVPGSTTTPRGSTRSRPRPPPRRVGEKGRQARQLVVKYEETALQLIRQAFEREAPEKRAAFWRETVQADPAFKAIRRRIKFEDLIVTNK